MTESIFKEPVELFCEYCWRIWPASMGEVVDEASLEWICYKCLNPATIMSEQQFREKYIKPSMTEWIKMNSVNVDTSEPITGSIQTAAPSVEPSE